MPIRKVEWIGSDPAKETRRDQNGCCSFGRTLSDLRAEYDALPDGAEKSAARIRHDGALTRTKTAEQVLGELRALPKCSPPSPAQYELARQYYLLRDIEEILKDMRPVKRRE